MVAHVTMKSRFGHAIGIPRYDGSLLCCCISKIREHELFCLKFANGTQGLEVYTGDCGSALSKPVFSCLSNLQRAGRTEEGRTILGQYRTRF